MDTTSIWPFPQMLSGKSCYILAIRDTDTHYYYMDHVGEMHLIFTIANLGYLPEIADFGRYVFVTDGYFMFQVDTVTNSMSQVLPGVTVPLMRTVCNLSGQAVGGNVDNWYGCDETFYVWSKIGSFDFTPDNDNEAGFRRCPFGGDVFNVRKLGNSVIGYSSEGLTKLTPVSDPTPTIGFREITDIGIINQGAINGDERQHLYVGSDLRLRTINAEGNFNELGYHKYISRLGNDIIVSYNRLKKHYYISDGEVTFVLTPNGLTEVQQHPSTVWVRNRQAYLLPDEVDLIRPYILTNAYDMNYKGLKTVMTVESDISHIDDPQANVVYYQDSHNIFETPNFPTNDQGITTVIISGSAFKLNVNFSEISPETKVSYIKARYKMTDLRGIRGVYAPPIRGQEYAK